MHGPTRAFSAEVQIENASKGDLCHKKGDVQQQRITFVRVTLECFLHSARAVTSHTLDVLLVYIGRFIEAKFAKRLHIGARTGVKTIFQ